MPKISSIQSKMNNNITRNEDFISNINMENNHPKFMIMNNQTDIRLATLIQIYDSHTSLFSDLIIGITERDIKLLGESIPIQWTIGSQVHLRFDIANWMGIDEKQNSEELFQDNRLTQLNITYPTIEVFNDDWKRISPILREAIMELDNEDLFVFSENEPMEKGTFFDLLSFVIEREKDCISMIRGWRGILT